MKKVLLIGDGARENALAEALFLSPEGYRVYAISSYKNPGINEIVKLTEGEYFIGDINSKEFVREIIRKINPDFGVIGPEEPLFHGVSDVFREEGIGVVGASSKCSMIEKSKGWMRKLMWKYKINGRLRFVEYNSLNDAIDFIMSHRGSIVLKPEEQAGGKGVKVIADLQRYLSDEKRRAASESVENVSKLSHGKILIEEKVDGIEYTLHVLADGYTSVPLPLAQDYKNAFSFGVGPETGGMGSISGPSKLLPFINEEEYENTFKIVNEVRRKVEEEVKEKYVGIIGGQMMLTDIWGPTVIEFYSRFGDPEASAILPRIESDFGQLLELIAYNHLSRAIIKVKEEPSVTWALAPLGYPLDKKIASGHEIVIDVNKIKEKGCKIYFGSIALDNSRLLTKGSRALELTVVSNTFNEAVKKLEECVAYVSSSTRLIYRKDIGRGIDEMTWKSEIIRYAYKKREKEGRLGVPEEWIDYV